MQYYVHIVAAPCTLSDSFVTIAGLGDRYFMATPFHEVGNKTNVGILEVEVDYSELGQNKGLFQVRNRKLQFNFIGMSLCAGPV